MGEMKRMVIENYPADKLPEELRRGLETGTLVRVTIESEVGTEASPKRSLASFLGTGKGCYTEEEAVSYIRKLRDEWET